MQHHGYNFFHSPRNTIIVLLPRVSAIAHGEASIHRASRPGIQDRDSAIGMFKAGSKQGNRWTGLSAERGIFRHTRLGSE
jgi:hypothetical protein